MKHNRYAQVEKQKFRGRNNKDDYEATENNRRTKNNEYGIKLK